MPGIVDAHLHFVGAALAAEQVDLTPARTDRRRPGPGGRGRPPNLAPWLILGGGWDQRRFGAWPTADALESVAPGRLIALRAFDHHALWASSAALTAAGIDRSADDPAGGVIRRDTVGEPEGVLLENAGGLVIDLVPPPDVEMTKRAMQTFGRELLRLGVVGAHDPASLAPDPENRALDVYAELAEAGELPVRIRACVRADGLDNAIERGLRSGGGLGGADKSRLSFGWLKLFADGTLGSKTAALIDPVEGGSDTGLFLSPPERLAALASRAADAGIATMIHAIGDAACRTALDILGPTRSKVPFMPRIEHVQLLHPADRHRFAALGIAASVQPVHLREDAETARRDWGPRAEANGYTWRSLLDAGATLAFGTDAPVEPADPWPGIAISSSAGLLPGARVWSPTVRLRPSRSMRRFARRPSALRRRPGSRLAVVWSPGRTLI